MLAVSPTTFKHWVVWKPTARVSGIYLLADLLSPPIVLNAMAHLLWEGHFGLILFMTIHSWSWYACELSLFDASLTQFYSCFQVKQELALNEPHYKSSRRLLGLVSSCLQELSYPWYAVVSTLLQTFHYFFEWVLLLFSSSIEYFRLYDVSFMCHIVGCNGISVHVFKAALQQLGFEVGTSHTNPQGIKSNAEPSVSLCKFIVCGYVSFTPKFRFCGTLSELGLHTQSPS